MNNVPQVSAATFALRRQRLLASLPPDTLVLIANAPLSLRNGDAYHPYRPNSDFYYLTGFVEPEAIALLRMTDRGVQFILFNQTNDLKEARWSGPRVGQLGACMHFGADEAYPIAAFGTRLSQYLAQCQTICYLMRQDKAIKQHLDCAMQASYAGTYQWIDLGGFVHRMRLIKDLEEIECLKKAAQISALAHHRAMQFCRAGCYEYEIEAELLHEFYRYNSRITAYESIVAGGRNACTLHYRANQSLLEAGDLLLVDAGCEYQYYASDITRTFPVNGRFNNEQRALYELVLTAQTCVIQEIRPGVCWLDVEAMASQILQEGLMDLGILNAKNTNQEGLRAFYPHSLGHCLGLDVHDVTDIWRKHQMLQTNMVVTVEPGLYIPIDHFAVDMKWRGIGIRIEDDVWVTEAGCQVLSAAVPKTIDEVENCCG